MSEQLTKKQRKILKKAMIKSITYKSNRKKAVKECFKNNFVYRIGLECDLLTYCKYYKKCCKYLDKEVKIK